APASPEARRTQEDLLRDVVELALVTAVRTQERPDDRVQIDEPTPGAGGFGGLHELLLGRRAYLARAAHHETAGRAFRSVPQARRCQAPRRRTGREWGFACEPGSHPRHVSPRDRAPGRAGRALPSRFPASAGRHPGERARLAPDSRPGATWIDRRP